MPLPPLRARWAAGEGPAKKVTWLELFFDLVFVAAVPQAEALSARHLAGHGIAGVLWLVSALVPAPIRFVVWAVALLIDLGTPWTTVGHTVTAPPDAEHLPERVGLFTI